MGMLKYRPALDGIRAIAVMSIFIFHLNKTWLSGGFVGVDIFFVLSGYLITLTIYNEISSKSFSFLRFYQRRIARIFPAYFLVTVCTLGLAKYLYTDLDLASTGAAAIAAAVSLANIKYMLQGGYFEVLPDSQPLLHYWSLSVEEQFYILFPLFLFLLYKYIGSKKKILCVIILFLLLSLLSCIYVTQLNSTWSFYLLPTRAWELLAGCTLAIYKTEKSQGNVYLRYNCLQVTGLFIMFLSIFFVNEGQEFPGYIALLPVMGTLLIIYEESNKAIERLFSFAPIIYTQTPSKIGKEKNFEEK